jgi:hypothetical protein
VDDVEQPDISFTSLNPADIIPVQIKMFCREAMCSAFVNLQSIQRRKDSILTWPSLVPTATLRPSTLKAQAVALPCWSTIVADAFRHVGASHNSTRPFPVTDISRVPVESNPSDTTSSCSRSVSTVLHELVDHILIVLS